MPGGAQNPYGIATAVPYGFPEGEFTSPEEKKRGAPFRQSRNVKDAGDRIFGTK